MRCLRERGADLQLQCLPGLCDQIAAMRRKLQKIATARILFLDETALRLSAAPTHTIVLPGEQPTCWRPTLLPTLPATT